MTKQCQQLAEKNDSGQAKLIVPKPSSKTSDELACEEYLKQVELAIENH